MNALLTELRQRNPQFADGLLSPILNYLVTARQMAGGDLDCNIILLMIAIRTIEHPDFGQLSQEARLDVPVFPSLGVNSRSIAESSGIPRETVRRKVASMIRKGWIAREGANLHFTAKAWVELSAIREAREQLALKYYQLVHTEKSKLQLAP